MFVLLEKSNIKVLPVKVITHIGEIVKFMCTESTKGSWRFNGGRLPANTKTFMKGITESWLQIDNVGVWNEGVYSCHDSVNTTRSSNFDDVFDDVFNDINEGTLKIKGKLKYINMNIIL